MTISDKTRSNRKSQLVIIATLALAHALLLWIASGWLRLPHVIANPVNFWGVVVILIWAVFICVLFAYQLRFLIKEAAEIAIDEKTLIIKTIIGTQINTPLKQLSKPTKIRLPDLKNGKLINYFLIRSDTSFFIIAENFPTLPDVFSQIGGQLNS